MNQTETNVDQQTKDLAKQLTAPMIEAFVKKKKRFAARNRDAHKRMNRPHKQAQIERGGAKIMALVDRFTGV